MLQPLLLLLSVSVGDAAKATLLSCCVHSDAVNTAGSAAAVGAFAAAAAAAA
jgi:hypothetical protein